MPPPAVASPKHPDFLFRQTEPPNGGPPPELMLRDFATAPDLFYVRNHGPTPTPDPATYRLRVGGLVARELSLSLDELRRSFPVHTVPATLQCAGNRRADLIRVAPIPGEVPWGGEAISHGEWTGARLADVLAAAGVDRSDGSAARHVEFLGLDRAEKEGKRYDFGGSIPLAKALADETLLAYALNGSPLPALHGFPVRALVPGYIGARSVKWLDQVHVRPDPSPNQFQAKQYRLYPADVRADTADPARGLPLGETAVNADICRVESAADGTNVTIEGWAIGGGGRAVSRVEVSTDDGTTWKQATFTGLDAGPWAWRFWRAEVPGPAPAALCARAWDTAANTQPERAETLWNFKGYANNAWARWPVPAGAETTTATGREIEYFI